MSERQSLPLVVKHKAGESPTVELDGVHLEDFLAVDGLKVEWGTEDGMPPEPKVTMIFPPGALSVDLDVDLRSGEGLKDVVVEGEQS